MTTIKKRKRYVKDHIVKILLLLIIVWLFFTLVGNQIRSFMVKAEEVKPVVLEHVETGYGLMHGSEFLVFAQADGAAEAIVMEGERVRKGNAVFQVEGVYSYTNEAGRVSYQLDGLEEVADLNAICSTDLETRYDQQQEEKNVILENAVNGQAYAKVINTFDNLYLYVTVPRSIYTASLELEQKIPVRLLDLDLETNATIVEMLDTVDGFRYLKLKMKNVEESVFQQRIYQVAFPYEQTTAIAVSPNALIEQDGQMGVYYLQKGFVFWKPVVVGQEWADAGLVVIESGLESGDVIVTTPHLVHEGENIKF